MRNRLFIQLARAMSLAEVKRVAPSIFAQAPHSKMSGRYTLIPTSKVLEALLHVGFVPTRVMQARARNESGVSAAKHLVRLRHTDHLDPKAAVDAVVPEVVLVNSHDGSSSYQLHAGLYRFVCCNGMVVADVCAGSLSIRHTGNVAKILGRVADYRGVIAILITVDIRMSGIFRDRTGPHAAGLPLAFRMRGPSSSST